MVDTIQTLDNLGPAAWETSRNLMTRKFAPMAIKTQEQQDIVRMPGYQFPHSFPCGLRDIVGIRAGRALINRHTRPSTKTLSTTPSWTSESRPVALETGWGEMGMGCGRQLRTHYPGSWWKSALAKKKTDYDDKE